MAEKGEWKIDRVDSYYYQSGRNYNTYEEITYWYNPETLERKETKRSETILYNQAHSLPDWAKPIKERNRKLESNYF